MKKVGAFSQMKMHRLFGYRVIAGRRFSKCVSTG